MLLESVASKTVSDPCHVFTHAHIGLSSPYFSRRGLLPAGWQETFRSAASRLALTQKSPASRLAADLKVSCQPATITYQMKYFIGIYVQLCLKSSNPKKIFLTLIIISEFMRVMWCGTPGLECSPWLDCRWGWGGGGRGQDKLLHQLQIFRQVIVYLLFDKQFSRSVLVLCFM